MEKKINIILNCVYYGFYLLLAGTAGWMLYLSKNGMLEHIEPLTQLGQTLQYIVICDVLVSVAGGLYLFKRLIDKSKKVDTKEDLLKKYRNWGIVRISMMGIGAVLGVAGFYILGGYTSMLWCAGVAIIGMFFCKPSKQRMEYELRDGEENLNDE